MAKGRELLLAMTDGSGGFDAVAVTEQRSISINNEAVDITKPDLANPGGKLSHAVQAGIQRISFSGAGASVNIAANKVLTLDAFNQTIKAYQISVPEVGTFTGDLYYETLEFNGDKTNETQFSFSAVMTGTIVFAPTA
ncbi:MAG: phage tail tube protein [Lentilitoribacter sp.]